MDKQTLTRDIKREIGNFPNEAQIARYLGKGRRYVVDLMQGVDALEDGRGRQYFAGDVAQRLMERRTVR